MVGRTRKPLAVDPKPERLNSRFEVSDSPPSPTARLNASSPTTDPGVGGRTKSCTVGLATDPFSDAGYPNPSPFHRPSHLPARKRDEVVVHLFRSRIPSSSFIKGFPSPAYHSSFPARQTVPIRLFSLSTRRSIREGGRQRSDWQVARLLVPGSTPLVSA